MRTYNVYWKRNRDCYQKNTNEIEVSDIKEKFNSLLSVEPIELEVGYGIIPLADVNQGGDLLDRVSMIRQQIALELGCVVPNIRLRDNIQLNPNQYVIKINNISVSFHLPAVWITESHREGVESLGYTVEDPTSIIATHLEEVIRSYLDELLTRQDVQGLIDNIKD